MVARYQQHFFSFAKYTISANPEGINPLVVPISLASRKRRRFPYSRRKDRSFLAFDVTPASMGHDVQRSHLAWLRDDHDALVDPLSLSPSSLAAALK